MPALITYVQAILSTTPNRLHQLADTLPLDLLAREPVAGEWSALDCLRHFLVTERELFPVRVRALLHNEGFVDFDPNRPRPELDAYTPAQLASAFADLRQQSLALLPQLQDDDLQRATQHPKLGTVTLAQLLNTWAAHDLNHLVQAERALMQPFMLACGPWRAFFRDHEISTN
jgi:uncharacterized damage-inducible protein DinB